jgi:hypothetical protein
MGRRQLIRWLLAVVLAGGLAACAPSTPRRPTADGVPSSRPSVTSRCSLITVDELTEIAGLTVQSVPNDREGACIFNFATTAPAQDISLFWFKTGADNICPSCQPIPGLGDAAGWSDTSRQLDVFEHGTAIAIYVQIAEERLHGATRRDVALKVFRRVEPRLP